MWLGFPVIFCCIVWCFFLSLYFHKTSLKTSLILCYYNLKVLTPFSYSLFSILLCFLFFIKVKVENVVYLGLSVLKRIEDINISFSVSCCSLCCFCFHSTRSSNTKVLLSLFLYLLYLVMLQLLLMLLLLLFFFLSCQHCL